MRDGFRRQFPPINIRRAAGARAGCLPVVLVGLAGIITGIVVLIM